MWRWHAAALVLVALLLADRRASALEVRVSGTSGINRAALQKLAELELATEPSIGSLEVVSQRDRVRITLVRVTGEELGPFEMVFSAADGRERAIALHAAELARERPATTPRDAASSAVPAAPSSRPR